jgi:Na+-driven multidrug efflux pump
MENQPNPAVSYNTQKQNAPEDFYPIKGTLTFQKLLEFLPAMIATNLSMLLLITVDALVAGNLVGKEALASISVFEPVTTFIGVITAVFSTGISTVLSNRIGNADTEGIERAKRAVKTVTVAAALLVSVIQIPIVYGLIYSYDLSEAMLPLVKSYATGIMISTPFGLISAIGTYELQIMGRMKVLMWLSVFEGLTNLALDILFAGPLGLGVAGTGYGTAVACTLRSIATMIYMYRKTDLYRAGSGKTDFSDIREIISKGLPESAYNLVTAFQNYAIMRILIVYFGDEGGTIKAVCMFCYLVTNVLMTSVLGSIRPLVGLLAGAEMRKGVRKLMQQGLAVIVALAGICLVIIETNPVLFYHLHGVSDIPEEGVTSLRLYAPCIVFMGVNAVFRMYFANRGAQKFSTILTLVGNSMMPLFAAMLGAMFPAPAIWLSYLFSALIIFIASIIRYVIQVRRDNSTEKTDIMRLYMSVEPENAISASKTIQKFASDHGYSLRLSNRARLCMEEMVAYSVKASGKKEVRNQIMVCFSKDEVIFMMLDDGECIVLDEDKEKQSMITDNYALLKRVAKSVQYQYVINLNHTILKFREA